MATTCIPWMILPIAENVTVNVSLNVNTVTDLPSSSARPSGVIFVESTIMLLIISGAIFGNILVIMSVFKYERLRIITNYFIVSLAFADLLVASLVMPFNFLMHITGEWPFGRTMCDIFNSNDVLFSTASILHLCLISMDRYIAILHPLQYESKMSNLRVGFMLCVTWGAACLISYIPIHSQMYTTKENFEYLEKNPDICNFVVNRIYVAISSSVSFWTPCSIMLFTYFKIFREARKQEEQIQMIKMQHRISSATYSNGNTRGSQDSSNDRSERRRMKKEHKAAKTLGIIMGGFIMCWLPFFLWYVITNMCGEQRCPTPDIIIAILFWIGYFNSCLNPIIYAYFNRDFRHAFKKILRLDRCCRKDPSSMALNATYTSEHRDSGTVQLTYEVSKRSKYR